MSNKRSNQEEVNKNKKSALEKKKSQDEEEEEVLSDYEPVPRKIVQKNNEINEVSHKSSNTQSSQQVEHSFTPDYETYKAVLNTTDNYYTLVLIRRLQKNALLQKDNSKIFGNLMTGTNEYLKDRGTPKDLIRYMENSIHLQEFICPISIPFIFDKIIKEGVNQKTKNTITNWGKWVNKTKFYHYAFGKTLGFKNEQRENPLLKSLSWDQLKKELKAIWDSTEGLKMRKENIFLKEKNEWAKIDHFAEKETFDFIWENLEKIWGEAK